MGTLLWLLALVIVGVILPMKWLKRLRDRRAAFIRNYEMPLGLLERLQQHRPSLTGDDCQLVVNGLRQFFLAHLFGYRKFTSMPSRIVSDLWQEFALYPQHYEQFCRQAFGVFMHHSPPTVLSPDEHGNTGLRRCWLQACKLDGIDPRHPERLPLLFILDAQLNIANGFRYVLDCGVEHRTFEQRDGTVYCAGAFLDTENEYWIADHANTMGEGGSGG